MGWVDGDAGNLRVAAVLAPLVEMAAHLRGGARLIVCATDGRGIVAM